MNPVGNGRPTPVSARLRRLQVLIGLALATVSVALDARTAFGADPAPVLAGSPGPPDSALLAGLASLQSETLVRRSGPMTPVMLALYSRNGFRPLWLDGALPSAAAQTAHARLAGAGTHGLDAADYRSGWIGERMAALSNATAPIAASDLAQLDLTLTLALLRYLVDLHQGRASTRQVTGRWVPAPEFPSVEALLESLGSPRQLQKFIDDAAPGYPIYGRLLKARVTYEALIAGKREAPRLVLAEQSAKGAIASRLPAIANRLIELGDLDEGASLSGRNEGAFVDAVKHFQQRHGLADDGVIGKGTLTAIQVSNRQRLRQIDLALERLRWLPPLTSPRVIGINIPEFRLWAYARDPADGDRMKPALQRRVVVGREGRTPTPVFIAQMSAIDFSPFWNVPISIARGEVLPRLRLDPEYLDRQEMEFVATDGRTSATVSPANLAAVERGTMRIRQRPGGRNALGKIKFTMPNAMNIYLHDTPSRLLFSESRRDFSHGCIRVEEPEGLGQWALADDPSWNETSIRQAMDGNQLRVVRLATPIPVVVFYTTATVDDDGTLRFLPDIYGHDRTLDALMPIVTPMAP